MSFGHRQAQWLGTCTNGVFAADVGVSAGFVGSRVPSLFNAGILSSQQRFDPRPVQESDGQLASVSSVDGAARLLRPAFTVERKWDSKVAVKIPFRYDDDFEYGKIHQISPLVRRIVANNPSRFTFRGTGTYVVGWGQVAVIDPGPLLDSHISAIANQLEGETISHILVTHTHSDHSPAARPLQRMCGAPIYGCRLPVQHHSDGPSAPVEEDIDANFRSTVEISDGDVLKGKNWTLKCVHTPGHMSNHFCFRLLEEKALFSGDHVMGWSTTVIVPPEGSMSDYMNSLDLLLEADDEVFYPTHGPSIRDPNPFVQAYKAHRIEREEQIVDCLKAGMTTVGEIVPIVYRNTDRALHAAAARSLFATLIKLWEEKKVLCDTEPKLNSSYRLDE